MVENIVFFSYNPKGIAKLKKSLECHIQTRWLANEMDLVFQICDELLKNAIKSNYRFLLLLEAVKKYIMETNSTMITQEVDAKLRKVFYSGDSILLEGQLKKIPDLDRLNKETHSLINLESRALLRQKDASPAMTKRLDPEFEPLLRIKRLARKHKVYVRFRLKRTESETLIIVTNDSPIMKDDVKRIQSARKRFKEYYDAGQPECFFAENIDTTGGGHGLGYALMDAILLQMKLEPERVLYLVPSESTKVVLVLPLERPAKTRIV